MKTAREEKMQQYLNAQAEKLPALNDIASVTFVALTENGTVPVEKAAEHPDLYDAWEAGQHYTVGRILYREDTDYLYRVRQEHDSLAVYPPEITHALYERIPKPGEGSHDSPIPYDASIGMALTEGKYYTEADVLYLCTRDSGVPVYNRLADLVGIYVELA